MHSEKDVGNGTPKFGICRTWKCSQSINGSESLSASDALMRFGLSPRFRTNVARFHGELDEGYATALGKVHLPTRLSPSTETADENLLPNELPAILQHGELVITPEQQRSIIGNLQHYAPVPFMDAGTCSEHSAANPIINNYNI